jgi:hypothetical protein
MKSVKWRHVICPSGRSGANVENLQRPSELHPEEVTFGDHADMIVEYLAEAGCQAALGVRSSTFPTGQVNRQVRPEGA